MVSLLNSLYGRLLLALLFSLLALNFGDALIFDRVFFTFLVLATLVSFAINKDTFSILAIVCLFFGFEELNWLIIQEGALFDIDKQSLVVNLYCYGFCLLSCYLERHDTITKYVFAVTLIALVFEAWWQFNNLPGKQIQWFVFTSAIALMAKHVLFFRPHVLYKHFPRITDWTFCPLDQDFEVFLKLLLYLEIAMISEYLLRYSLENNQIIYVYHGYSYLAHAINLYLLLSSLLQIKRDYFKKHLHA